MARPWGAYGLRIFCCALLFVSGYALLAGSTFALRMRDDAPVGTLVIAVAGSLAFLPLLFGRRFLGAFLASAFALTGLGAYWWTTIPWDELVKDSGFPTPLSPRLLDYALVASPSILVAFYAAVSRPSTMRADLKDRGADTDEIRTAACASFLSGAALLVVCGGLSAALWALMASRVPFRALAPMPMGLPALIVVAALVTVAYALLGRRLPSFRDRAPRAPAAPEATPAPRAIAAAGAVKGAIAKRLARKAAE